MTKPMSRQLLASALPLLFAAPAYAQGPAPAVDGGQAAATGGRVQLVSAAGAETDDTILVTGTRRRDRSVTDSAVAVDVIAPETLATTGFADVNDALRTLLPSFNVHRLSGNDGSSFVRPVTLRGSPADHVLLLLNGKRRHRAAIVQIGTGHATTSGSQGQDYNVIPPIALSSIEVLRDGASAQYGSDAVAGVINLEMKSDRQGGSLMAQVGKHFDTGGENYDLQGNVGLPIGQGFLNVSAQFTDQFKTFSPGKNNGAEALRAMGVAKVPVNAAGSGEPRYQAVKTTWNAAIPIGGEVEGYMFGNFMLSNSSVGFFYRQSTAAGGLPAHASFRNSAFDNTPAYPENWDLRSIYPGGFTPEFGGEMVDYATVVGIRDNEGDFNWDIFGRLGNNKVDYSITSTINPSLGAASPTNFKPGSLAQREIEFGGDASYKFASGVFASDILVFGGVSYRRETYTIGAGNPLSYAVGPLRDLPVGSNGFQGFSPDIAGEFDSSSYAVFAEVDLDFTEAWNFSVAGRYEDYTEFGSNFSYKAATRLRLSDSFAIRGSVSTGFRAPAAGQLFGSSQTSQINAQNQFILDAVLIPGSPAAQVFGSSPLIPETSFNMSAGLVFTSGRLLFTLDFYQIDVDDRLLLTPSVVTTAAQRAALAALNFPNGASVQQVRWFQNKLDTRVRGFDLVSTYGFDWGQNGQTDISLAVNYNEQKLRTDPSAFFGPSTVIEFERGLPRWRGTASANTSVGDFGLLVRGNYFGAWKRRDGATFRERDPAVLVDAEISYRGIANTDLSVGARNILNKFPPDRGEALKAVGLIRDNHSVFGVSGGFYYLSARYRF